MAFELIETVEVGSGGASQINFTSLPQDALHLFCVISARATNNGNVILTYLNNDTSGSNYNSVNIYGDGTTVDSSKYSAFAPFAVDLPPNTTTSNTFSNGSLSIYNYSASQQTIMQWESVYENNAAAAKKSVGSVQYTPSSAITALRLSASFAQYSQASLYKIY